MPRADTDIENTFTLHEAQGVKRDASLFIERFRVTYRLLVARRFVAELQVAHTTGSLDV